MKRAVVLITMLLATAVVLGILQWGADPCSFAACSKSKPGAAAEERARSEAISDTAAQSAASGASSSKLLGTPLPPIATLSNDLDHDGNPDGMADPLVVVVVLGGSLMVGLGGCFALLTTFVGGLLLLGLREPAILVGSDFRSPLERPG